MKKNSRLFILIVMLSLISGPSALGGQEPADPDEAVEGDADEEYKTVVTALGFEDKEFDSPRSIEVIDEDDMKRLQGRSTPEMVGETTGVFVQKTAHGHGAPIIRGVIGIHNLILFNEIRLNNSTWRTGPIQYLNLIDPFSIEKIEILRGPGSLLYGSDAVGGVISVFGSSPLLTDQPVLSPGLSGKFSSADLGYAGHYGLRLGCRHFGTVFGGSYKSFGDLRAGTDVGLQKFTGYSEADFDFNARVKLFSGGQLEIGTYLVSLYDVGRIDQLASNNRLRYNDNTRDLVYLRFIGEEKDLDLDYKLTLSYQHQTEVNKDIRYASLYDAISRITYDNVYVDTVGFSGSVSKKFLDASSSRAASTCTPISWTPTRSGSTAA
jgi:iron complex outermembrane receptor protein/hemoglobin/transferrin/lactoferrin receptor protein